MLPKRFWARCATIALAMSAVIPRTEMSEVSSAVCKLTRSCPAAFTLRTEASTVINPAQPVSIIAYTKNDPATFIRASAAKHAKLSASEGYLAELVRGIVKLSAVVLAAAAPLPGILVKQGFCFFESRHRQVMRGDAVPVI